MSSSKKVYEVRFDADDVEYTAQVEYEFIYDPKWGADADGNRGIPMTDIECSDVESIYDETNKKDIKEKDLSKNAQKAMEKAIDEFDDFDDGDDRDEGDSEYDPDDKE